MKRLLKAVLAFLERKFPDQVVITQSEYNSLFETISGYNQYLQLVDKRLIALEAKPSGVTELEKKVETVVNNHAESLRKTIEDVQKCKDEIGKLQLATVWGRGSSALER